MTSTAKDNRRLSEEEPLVSILLPVRDAAPWIGEAIESMLGQTYERIELVVIDNDSRDNSQRIARGFNDKRIKVLSQPRGFLVSTLNTGLKESKGSIIARQDADDYSASTRIEKQIEVIKKNAEIRLVGSSFNLISLRGDLLGVEKAITESQDIRKHLAHDMPFAGASIVAHKDLFTKLGGYDPFFDGKVGEDRDFLVRASEIANLTAIEEPLYFYRTNNPDSMCGRINYNYEEAKKHIRERATARGSIVFGAEPS